MFCVQAHNTFFFFYIIKENNNFFFTYYNLTFNYALYAVKQFKM